MSYKKTNIFDFFISSNKAPKEASHNPNRSNRSREIATDTNVPQKTSCLAPEPTRSIRSRNPDESEIVVPEHSSPGKKDETEPVAPSWVGAGERGEARQGEAKRVYQDSTM